MAKLSYLLATRESEVVEMLAAIKQLAAKAGR
jgi:hypothetical protein